MRKRPFMAIARRLMPTLGALLLVAIWDAGVSNARSEVRPPLVTRSSTCTPPDTLGNNRASCAAACPVGSTVVSGGCTALGNRPWSISDSAQSSNGWRCGSFDALGIGDGNYRNIGTQLAAQAYCQSYATSERAAWKLPASGGQIAIARGGGDLATEIARDFAICNVDSADPATALVYMKASSGTGFQIVDPAPRIENNKCLLVNRPTALFLANGETQARTIGGFYQAFQADALGLKTSSFEIVDLDSVGPSSPSRSNAVRKSIACKPVPHPNPTDNIYSTCAMPLTTGGNYRICFDGAYTKPQANGQPYPGTLAPMALDASLLSKPLPPTPPENLYNPIAVDSCRDLYDVKSAAFIIWPYRANPSDPTWRPEQVPDISASVEDIP